MKRVVTAACLWSGVIVALALQAPPATAQEPPSDPSERIAARANDIAALFTEEPSGYEDVFGDAFLAQVPHATLNQLFSGYHSEHGTVARAEVIGPFAGGATIVRFHFADGAAAILQFGLEPTAPYRVAGAFIGPAFQLGESVSGGSDQKVIELEYPTDDYETKTALRLPFDGAWFVFWGGRIRSENYHRASALQRYAYDFVIHRDGSSHEGDGTSNDDFYCEGEPLLAPAGGTVARAVDGVAENIPGEMNAEEALGNHVVIDHRNGEFSLLAHLRPGSLAVKRGESVAAGQLLGACGNSGNSSEPHLHYQLQDAPDFGTATSLPAPFVGYRADGVSIAVGEPRQGQTVMLAGDEAEYDESSQEGDKP